MSLGLPGRPEPRPRPQPVDAGARADDDRRPRWASFLFGAPGARLAVAREDVLLDEQRYVVQAVQTPLGAGEPIAVGSRLVRAEAFAPVVNRFAGELRFHGVEAPFAYASAAEAHRLAPDRPVDRLAGSVAVLLLLAKSGEWWRMPHDQRLALMRGSRSRPGHFAQAASLASRVTWRLYHARFHPGSVWDFLAFFTFAPTERGPFRELLSSMRDPARGLDRQFVEREVEIWLEPDG